VDLTHIGFFLFLRSPSHSGSTQSMLGLFALGSSLPSRHTAEVVGKWEVMKGDNQNDQT